MAFVNTAPAARAHWVVVPRTHGAGVGELDPREAARMMRLGQQLACALHDVVGADGVNLWLVDDPSAGQEVFHAHMHVVARSTCGGLTTADPAPEFSGELLDAVAAQIRAAL